MEKSVLNEAPEQTYNDESLLRPMSLANVSGLNDPSTDKSRISGQIWNEYRTPREPGTPLIGEEDVEDDQDTPRVKEISANKSMMTRFRERNNPNGFTFNEFQTKLDKANKTITDLKIRIYYLEQDQGLTEKTDQENVYRLNLDLKVEKESLKNDILEMEQKMLQKDEALREAFNAVEQHEEVLRQLDEERRKREELQALQAFGSMILDPGSEDKLSNANAKIDGLESKISSLEKELEAEIESKREFQTLYNEEKSKVADLERNANELEDKFHNENATNDETFKALKEKYMATQDRINFLENELATQNSSLKDAESHIDELQGQNTALIQQLAMEQNSAQILKGRQDEEVYQLKDEIVSLKKALDEEASSTKDHETYLNLKLTEIANLHKEINAYKESNNENLEKIQKLETGLDALAQVSEEQNTDRISISKELKKKNLMYDRLLTEYESAKAKVRKYRSERGSTSSMQSCGGTSQLEQPSGDHAKASYYIRQGAEKALTKANQVYNEQFKMIDQNHQQAMIAMRKRLEELADCLEKILNQGLLNISDSTREVLQMSLNESRRLSRSVFDTSNLNASSEGFQAMEIPKPYIEVNLEDLEVEINADLDNVFNEVKAKHEKEIEDMKVAISTLENELELASNDKEELETIVNEERSKVEEIEHALNELKEDSLKKLAIKEHLIITLKEELSVYQDRILLLEKEMEVQTSSKDELQDLRLQNEDLIRQLAEANEKIRDNKKRQDELDKVLRHQLAKTHTVLKRTKNAMNTLDNKENVE